MKIIFVNIFIFSFFCIFLRCHCNEKKMLYEEKLNYVIQKCNSVNYLLDCLFQKIQKKDFLYNNLENIKQITDSIIINVNHIVFYLGPEIIKTILYKIKLIINPNPHYNLSDTFSLILEFIYLPNNSLSLMKTFLTFVKHICTKLKEQPKAIADLHIDPNDFTEYIVYSFLESFLHRSNKNDLLENSGDEEQELRPDTKKNNKNSWYFKKKYLIFSILFISIGIIIFFSYKIGSAIIKELEKRLTKNSTIQNEMSKKLEILERNLLLNNKTLEKVENYITTKQDEIQELQDKSNYKTLATQKEIKDLKTGITESQNKIDNLKNEIDLNKRQLEIIASATIQLEKNVDKTFIENKLFNSRATKKI